MAQALDFGKFKLEFLNEINALRKEHGSPSLEYSDKLETGAFEKAKILLTNEEYKIENETRGINDIVVQLVTNMEIKPSFFVNNLKENRKEYDYKAGKYVEKAGGFTQAVWVNTKNFAVGYAQQGEKWFFVLRFYPHGNLESRFIENVKPQGSVICERTNDGPIPLKSVPTSQEIEAYFTKTHNQIREEYECKPLIWDKNLESIALKVAEATVDSMSNNKEAPKQYEEYGKNVAFSNNGIPSMDMIITTWYKAYKNFNYENFECNESNGSFVQIVNKETTNFCVIVYLKNNCCCYVALYHPRLIITENFEKDFPKPLHKTEIVFDEQL